ncbi:MAG: hypothetical protein GC156_02605 [Actinomycetales bacterium]|nr:hypothetical protein [Actinomycetales bacterium]
MGSRRRGMVRIGIAGVATAWAVCLPGTAYAAFPPLAPPPPTTDLVQATLAMSDMQDQPALLTGPSAKATFSTGFTNPPGGQDPWPVCIYGSTYPSSVAVPATLAVGYSSSNGYLTQTEYTYPTPAAGTNAWASLSASIAKHCDRTWTDEDGTSKVSRTRLPAQGAAGDGWAVATFTPSSVLYVTVAPVDGGIQQLVYYRQGRTLPAGVSAAVDALSYQLADTWAKRATLPMQQGWVTVDTAASMLRAADLPAELPVTSPAAGGWSSFSSTAPGSGPRTCTDNAGAGTWTSISSLGGWGDVGAEPGELMQEVEAYQSDSEVAEVWRQLRRIVLACNDPAAPAISQSKQVTRISGGVSEFVYHGVPALWLRQLTSDPQSGFTTKSYTVYLMAENNIQSLTYYLSRDGLRQIPLDQLAVNELARTLADRLLAAQSG